MRTQKIFKSRNAPEVVRSFRLTTLVFEAAWQGLFLPGCNTKFQVPNGGGHRVRWRRDGKEMFYFTADRRLMALDVSTSPRFRRVSLMRSSPLPFSAGV
jgi:hypothetical protein